MSIEAERDAWRELALVRAMMAEVRGRDGRVDDKTWLRFEVAKAVLRELGFDPHTGEALPRSWNCPARCTPKGPGVHGDGCWFAMRPAG